MTIPYYRAEDKFQLTTNGDFFVILNMMGEDEFDKLIPELTAECNRETGTFAQLSFADVCKNNGTGDVAVIAYFSPGMAYPELPI